MSVLFELVRKTVYFGVIFFVTFICIIHPKSYAAEQSELEKKIAESQGEKKVVLTLEYIKDASQYYPDKAESYIESALEIVAEDSSYKTQLLTHYARAKFYKSEFSQAEVLFEQALRRAIKSKNNNNLMLIYAHYSMQANELRNFDKSLQLIAEGLAIAHQENELSYIGQFYALRAQTYIDSFDHNQALNAALLSYQYYRRLNDKPAMVSVLRISASVYRRLAAYDKALEYQLKALTIILQTGNPRLIAIQYNNTAIIYKDLKDYDNAIDMHSKSLEIKKSIGYLRGQVYSHNNLGEVYRLAGKSQESLKHLTLANKLAQQINNEKLMYYAYLYLGRLHRDMAQYDVSYNYLNQALTYFINSKRESRASETYLALARLFVLQNKLEQALDMANKSLSLAQKVDKSIVIFGSYQTLSIIYQNMKNFEKAWENERVFQQQKDIFFNSQRQRYISTLKIEYDVEQQQREISELVQKNEIIALQAEKQINQRNIAIVFSLLIFVLVGFFYYRYNQRKKLEDKRIALMQIKAKEQDLIELNKNLENIVATRTESLTLTNQTLESTLAELKSTQDNLIEVEKMASLSKLVAGVAHEVNTPLGTIITAVSFLKEELASFKHMVIENKVSKVGLDSFLESITQSSELIEKNTSRSANLINEFKQVAAQKRADPPQAFVLKDCIDKVMVSILKNPCFKRVNYTLSLEGESIVTSYSTYWFQILETLLSNTVIHGFRDDHTSAINVQIIIEAADAQQINVIYQDNGCGIPESEIKSIFEPFYTTFRAEGHAGLGLHIIFNMITQTLKGSMYYQKQESGACFVITLPRRLNN